MTNDAPSAMAAVATSDYGAHTPMRNEGSERMLLATVSGTPAAAIVKVLGCIRNTWRIFAHSLFRGSAMRAHWPCLRKNHISLTYFRAHRIVRAGLCLTMEKQVRTLGCQHNTICVSRRNDVSAILQQNCNTATHSTFQLHRGFEQVCSAGAAVQDNQRCCASRNALLHPR